MTRDTSKCYERSVSIAVQHNQIGEHISSRVNVFLIAVLCYISDNNR